MIDMYGLNLANADGITGYVVSGEIVSGLTSLSPGVHTIGDMTEVLPTTIYVPGNSIMQHLISSLKSSLGCP